MARNVLPIRNNAVWSECCTESVYKIDEASNSLAARAGCSKLRMIIFLDDILVLAPLIETLNQHTRMTISLLESLGFLINYKKSLGDAHRLNDGIYFAKGQIRKYSKRVSIVSRSDVRLQHTSEPLQKGEIGFYLVDNQSTIAGGSPILPLTADLTISSDASKIGWGASWVKCQTGGRWNTHESAQDHINILELKAAFFALKSFAKDQINKVICLKIDNSTAVAYLNNKVGTHSHQLLQLTLEIWNWCETKRLYLLAQHVPGKNNVVADEESRKMRDHNDWKIDSTVIR
ncbi:Hypothetical predicted protein [Paramuricea clavata]|uniref:RNase H type-1 domain-containing protein n=1 Tax=Paramuricea clavata TaxID=317549 RepID=A0A7D9DQ73_PARCT|nr:Hypothetical predicted protein [Paramuricea clavata]